MAVVDDPAPSVSGIDPPFDPPATAGSSADAVSPAPSPAWPPSSEQPARPRQLSRHDRLDYLLAAGSGMAFAWALCAAMDWTHPMTFGCWALVWFLGAVYLLARDRTSKVVATDRLMTTLIWVCGAIAVGVLIWMCMFVLIKGLPGLDLAFFTDDLSEVGPLDDGGGAFHAVVGTLEQIAIATIIAVPIAILTAIYLQEVKGRLAVPVRFVVDAMSGLPSIVAGLIVFTIWVNEQGFSGVAAGVAMAVMMIPIVTRTSEEILRTVDDGLRESALALGAPQWRSVMRVVLPTARSGLITASILGVARAIGETAPVLLTAFGSTATNYNPFSSPQADLPLFVWSLLRQPNDRQIERAWTGALVLMLLVLVLFVAARWIGARGARKRGATR